MPSVGWAPLSVDDVLRGGRSVAGRRGVVLLLVEQGARVSVRALLLVSDLVVVGPETAATEAARVRFLA